MAEPNERVDNLVELSTTQRPPQAGTGDDICDEQFMQDLNRLKELRSFLIQQAVHLKSTESGTTSFGALNSLRYGKGGRSPTREEWSTLETLTQTLFDHLTDSLRRRFLYGQIPWWVSQLLLCLGIVAFVSLSTTFFVWGIWNWAAILTFYTLWLISLGAIGSIAFIGMNALSVQDDATFDLTNTKLMVLRIALGGLFGALLALPFGFSAFAKFVQSAGYYLTRKVLEGDSATPTETFGTGLSLDALLLLLPFILGFSTSLVILILNQFIEAIQSFFGRKSAPLPPATPAPIPNSDRGSAPAKPVTEN